MKVLLVEDDALMRKMISKTIRSRFEEIEFVECRSVSEAKEAHDSGGPFTFAVVDFEIIEGTGYDVVNYIRVEKGDKLLPIMMCTSHQDRKTVLKMLELGVNDYLAKPFQPKKIIDKVERLVERAKRIQESIEKRKQMKGGAASAPAASTAEASTETPAPTSAPVPEEPTAPKAPPASKEEATPADAPPAPEPEAAEKKGSVRHGELGEGIIDDSGDEDEIELIDLKNAGNDDDADVEVSDDMFLG